MLVRSISHISEFIPVNVSLEYDKVSAFIVDAERTIKETIGNSFYNELDAYVTTPDIPANSYKVELIRLLRDSITYMLFDRGFDILNTVFSNQGFHRIENESSGKKALFQRQEENLRKTFRQQGWNKLDAALAYMEDNKSEFATWSASDEYTLTKDRFINSSKEFNDIYNINNNRLVFMRLKKAQVLVEDFDIIPLIGIDFYEELKSQILSGTLTPVNNSFLAILKKSVAYRTIFRGGYELLAELNEFGFYEKQIASTTENFKTESLARDSIFRELISQAEQNGYGYLKSCESFLKTNIADYPLYAASTAYNSEGSAFKLNGTDKIGII